MELARRELSADQLGSSHLFGVLIAFTRADAAACTRHALVILDAASKVGPVYAAMGYFGLGCAHLAGGNAGEAVTALERAREILYRDRSGLMVEALTLDRLAEAYLAASDTARARAAVDDAIAVAEKRGTVGWGYRGPVTLARVLVASSGAAARPAAEAALTMAQAQVDQSGERVHQPFIHLARAELAAALGDAAGRQRELREAHLLFTEMGVPLRAELVAAELA
ncbi:MAG TPA: hypothetical protein VGJ70_21805 [Solirubrobacteraceae bacterium]